MAVLAAYRLRNFILLTNSTFSVETKDSARALSKVEKEGHELRLAEEVQAYGMIKPTTDPLSIAAPLALVTCSAAQKLWQPGYLSYGS